MIAIAHLRRTTEVVKLYCAVIVFILVIRTNCDAPQEIKNGHWMILGYHEKDNKYIIGSKILYECESNFQPYGSTLLECQGEAYWSVNPPMCLPKGNATVRNIF